MNTKSTHSGSIQAYTNECNSPGFIKAGFDFDSPNQSLPKIVERKSHNLVKNLSH